MDLLPTLVDLAGGGAALPANPDAVGAVEGGSLAEALKSGAAEVKRPREGIVIHFPHYDLNNGGPASAIYLGSWKLVRNYDTGRVSLYDIGKDRSESSDLAAANPEVVKDLEGRLDGYLKSVNAQMPRKNTAPGAGTGTPPGRPGGQGGGGQGGGGRGGRGGGGKGNGGNGGNGGKGNAGGATAAGE
jgi:arylsulfatase A-like enzyme